MFLTPLIAAILAVAQPAPAPAPAVTPGAAATLAAPGEARRELFDGRNWICGPDGVCVGRGAGVSQPALRECRRFVARFGAVARYERDGAALTGAQLAQCNTAAAR